MINCRCVSKHIYIDTFLCNSFNYYCILGKTSIAKSIASALDRKFYRYAYFHIYMFTYVKIYAYIFQSRRFICTYVYSNICTYIYIYIQIYASMYLFSHIYLYTSCKCSVSGIHICIYIYTYVYVHFCNSQSCYNSD
jgi:hypothetical protein